jgi:hypothetical protein
LWFELLRLGQDEGLRTWHGSTLNV